MTGSRVALALPVSVLASPALAGPPLSTEDPGVLAQGRWEIITATTATSTDSGEVYQAPQLDISYGLIGERVQVGATCPYVFSDSDGQGSASDFGNLELGVKWRFWNSRDLQVAFAPLYAFGVTRSLAERGIGNDADVLQLPLAAAYRVNDPLRFNAVLGYDQVDGGEDKWAYGTAVAYSLNDRWVLLGELAGSSDTDFEEDILEIRAGFDFAIAKNFHLLFSAATGLHEPADEDELDYGFYLGLQWFR